MDEKLNINSIFKERLNDLKYYKNETQEKIALGADISRQNLAKYLNDETLPNSYTLYKLAEYFNVSCDYLLGRTEELSVFSGNIKKLDSTSMNDLYIKVLQKHSELYSKIKTLKKEKIELAELLNRPDITQSLSYADYMSKIRKQEDIEKSLAMINVQYDVWDTVREMFLDKFFMDKDVAESLLKTLPDEN